MKPITATGVHKDRVSLNVKRSLCVVAANDNHIAIRYGSQLVVNDNSALTLKKEGVEAVGFESGVVDALAPFVVMLKEVFEFLKPSGAV